MCVYGPPHVCLTVSLSLCLSVWCVPLALCRCRCRCRCLCLCPSVQCLVLWDSFAPISCDTHAAASEVRHAFLRLLHQRGIDFKAAFDTFCTKLKDPSKGLTSTLRFSSSMSASARYFSPFFRVFTEPQFERMMLDAGIELSEGEFCVFQCLWLASCVCVCVCVPLSRL